jgi:hypothetical protein
LRTANGNPERLRRAVVDAEVLDFDPMERQELIALLMDFVRTHRQSGDLADVTAVGSAVRKLIAASPVSEAAFISAELLDAASSPSLPMEIEVSKMIVRKLVANPTARIPPQSHLTDLLWRLIDKYLDPAGVEEGTHGAVALDAILGLVLICGPNSPTILDRVRTFEALWFRQLIAWEAANLVEELRRTRSGTSCSEAMHSLEELASAASPGPTR